MSAPTPKRPDRAERKRRQRDELAGTSLFKGLKPSTATGAGVISASLLGLLWAVVIVNALLDHRLLRFGIKPRRLDGLDGIVLSPFLHASAAHLVANSVPFLVLAFLMLISGLRYFLIVTAAVVLAAGFVDWAAGPSGAVIVGASGVIFGWFGYLLARAFFARSLKWIGVAVAVGAVFSSLFSGMLPHLDSNVFWGGHVSGFVVGVLTAAALHRRRQPPVDPPAVPPAFR